MNEEQFLQQSKALLERAYALRNRQEAQALYRDWAKTYDRTMLDGLGYLTPLKTAQLFARFLTPDNQTILDVGAGTGLAGADLAKLGFTAIDAVDYSPQMLEVAASRNIYRHLITADLNARLEFPAATYDGMICTGTFTHAHVDAGCLEELFRILKPDGVFACTIHKDVWEEAGFAATSAAMIASGKIRELYKKPGSYYRDSKNSEGYYIVWQKTGGGQS